MRTAAADCGNCFESTMCKGHTSTVKGGENTEKRTKWETYAEMSKDELVIRLVEAETRHAEFVATVESLARDGSRWAIPDLGGRPPAEWLEKIIAYAKAHAGDGFSYMDLAGYGVDLDTAENLWNGED